VDDHRALAERTDEPVARVAPSSTDVAAVLVARPPVRGALSFPRRPPSSLSVGEGEDGRALVWCRAGCDTGDVLAALGLTFRDLFPNRWSIGPAGDRPAAWSFTSWWP
jgi:hypothetical protein